MASKEGLAPTPWTRLGTFKVHAKSRMHQMSCIDFAQSINPTGAMQKTLAPAVKHLKELATDFRANKRLKNKYSFAKRHKIRKMLWCLGEASRIIKINRFKGMDSIALHHDGGGGCLFVKFSMAHKWTRKIGFMAKVPMLKMEGQQDAVAIALSLKRAVEDACTLKKSVPFKTSKWHQKHTKLVPEAVEAVQEKLTLLNADAAGDEKAAMRLVSHGKVAVAPESLRADVDTIAKLFPNNMGQNDERR